MTQSVFDAVVTAGYNPNKVDRLALATGTPYKALTPVAGKPMVWHVVRALVESGQIGELVVVGLDAACDIDFGYPIHFVPNQESLWASQYAGLYKLQEINPADRYALTTAADAPLLTGEMVRWFVQACQPLEKDLYWGVVRREVMEEIFPQSRRSYLHLREGSFCNGDIALGKLQAAMSCQMQIREMLAYRKNVLRQARLLGFRILLRLLFRRLDIPELIGVGKRWLNIDGAPVEIPFAEVGMDVDKPHQLDQVLAYLKAHPEHPVHARRLPDPPAQDKTTGDAV